MKKISYLLIAPLLALLLAGCSGEGGGLNIFTLEDDIAFGRQLDEQILSDPAEYPILDPATNPEAYAYVEGIMDMVLESDLVNNKSNFPWQVRIIDKDVLNAFAAPGGFLYFYSGFVKFAESEAELAGVMAHEIAHSDRRHSTETMTKQYGIQVMLGMMLGSDPGLLSQVAAQLALGGASMQFSQKHEFEADEYALRYLNSIRSTRGYYLPAMKDFFNRMEVMYEVDGDGSAIAGFFRTHPYNDDREAAMDDLYIELGSPAGDKFIDNHSAQKAYFP